MRADLPLSRGALAWRAASAAGILLGAVWGTAIGADEHWPLAPMSQFAFRTDPDSEVRAAYLVAVTTEGRAVRLPLDNGSIGMNRGELEGQLDRLVARPSGLQALADARRRKHPEDPAYVRIELWQSVERLQDGRSVGASDELRAAWDLS